MKDHVDINDKLLINNEPIHVVGETNEQESIKFLGIYLDKHLTLKQHNTLSMLICIGMHFCN